MKFAEHCELNDTLVTIRSLTFKKENKVRPPIPVVLKSVKRLQHPNDAKIVNDSKKSVGFPAISNALVITITTKLH